MTGTDPIALAGRLAAAHWNRAALPRATLADPGLDLAGAYRVQRELVAALVPRRPILGYKGALTAPAAQRALGIDTPVTGVLLRHPGHDGGTQVRRDAFVGLMLETELSFRLARDVTEPLADDHATRGVVAGVAPAIELADLAFAEGGATGVDLVAANSAFGSFIRGDEFVANDLDALDVTLSRDGEVVHRGSSGSVMGGQLLAVRWIVNEVVAGGGSLCAGQILLTGSIGGLQPGVPGAWVAGFGSAGRIEFSVT
jgi:2-keto-4-pentenoate hydratase